MKRSETLSENVEDRGEAGRPEAPVAAGSSSSGSKLELEDIPPHPEGRPRLLYDGSSESCERWIRRFSRLSFGRVDYVAAESVKGRMPQMILAKTRKSVVYLDAHTLETGARAVFSALSHSPVPPLCWLLRLYDNLPGFGSISEALYRRAAKGRHPQARRSFEIGSWLFLRGMGLVYLCAFLSLWVQFEGLFGERGILPVGEYLALIEARAPDSRFQIAPTLAWLDPSNSFLNLLCIAGVVASVLVLLGVAQLPALALLWLLYLSLSVAGQTFFRFQWDSLLLEAGLLSVLFAPLNLAPRAPQSLGLNSRIGRFLLVFLLFKLMFLAGLVKLLSGDETWRGLSALNIHYQTQPLPHGLSWWAHHLPEIFHKLGTAATLGIELALPFFVFGPVLLRRISALSFIGLMALISLTGNYGFFNLLTVVLCLLIIDDGFFNRILPAGLQNALYTRKMRPAPTRKALPWWLLAPVALILWQQSAMKLLDRSRVELPWPQIARSLEGKLQPLRSINNYGLFASMTTRRPEIILEGSSDGRHWEPYELHWKPGDPERRPRFAGPHMPRLDWQLWFAALSSAQRNSWLLRYMDRLLEGEESALKFISHNPFPDSPPRFIRAVVYEYRYSDSLENGYWERELLGLYTRPRDLPGGRVAVP